jgi:hypothetical protein
MHTLIKYIRIQFVAVIVLFIGLGQIPAAVLTGVEPTYITVGTGPDVSYLVIDESDLNSRPLVFAYYYKYDTNNPLTGYSLLTNVAAGSSLVTATTFFGGGLGNALDSLAYQGGATVTGTNAPDYSEGTYWGYYLSGSLDEGIDPDLIGRWGLANIGMDSRVISPGSIDGWTLTGYADYGSTIVETPPSVEIAAVPEPNPMLLVLLSLTSSYLFLRWKRDSQNQDL